MNEQLSKETKFEKAFRSIAICFINRLGIMTLNEIEFELDLIINQIGIKNLEKSIGGKFENKAYVTMSRVGAKKRLNREIRIDIAGKLNKALEHAHYEVYNNQ